MLSVSLHLSGVIIKRVVDDSGKHPVATLRGGGYFKPPIKMARLY